MAWEGVGLQLLLLGGVAWTGDVCLVVRRGQERVVDVRRLGNALNESLWDRGLRSGGVRKSGGADGRNVRGLGVKGEWLDIFVLHKTSDVSAPVFGVYNVLQLLLIAAADPEEDSQRDYSDTSYAPYDTTDDGTDDGRRGGASGKADLIRLGTVGISDLDDAR